MIEKLIKTVLEKYKERRISENIPLSFSTVLSKAVIVIGVCLSYVFLAHMVYV